MSDEHTLTAMVEFISCSTGDLVKREFTISKSDINDVSWFGGETGDSYFDDEFESDQERFEQRVEDCIHGQLWLFLSDDEVDPDPDLVGDQPNGLDYNDSLNFEYSLGNLKIEDFYPSNK
jgi:hypothetical protein